MPTYTNTWNESIPVGGDPANTADDWLRQEKLDMRERLNTIAGLAVGTPFADPIIPAFTGKIYIPVWEMAWVSAAGTLAVPANNTAVGLDVVQATHTTGYFHCALKLPVGVTIPIAGCALSVNESGASLVYDIICTARPKTGTVTSNVLTGSGSGAMTGALNLPFGPAAPYTILADNYYVLGFYVTPVAGSTCTVFGVEVNYTARDINTRF